MPDNSERSLNIVCFWVRNPASLPVRLYKHSLSSRFFDSCQNALKIMEITKAFLLAVKSKTSEEISASGYIL